MNFLFIFKYSFPFKRASDWLIVNLICRTQSINKLSFQEALLIIYIKGDSST